MNRTLQRYYLEDYIISPENKRSQNPSMEKMIITLYCNHLYPTLKGYSIISENHHLEIHYLVSLQNQKEF